MRWTVYRHKFAWHSLNTPIDQIALIPGLSLHNFVIIENRTVTTVDRYQTHG